jgi:type I restriction enzyme, S subunit
MTGKYRAYVEYKSAESKWMDILPAHWKRAPIKYLVAIRITDGPHETPEFVDEGIPFLSAEAVKNYKLDFTKKRGCITRSLHEIYSKKCLPQIDDVFMVKSGNTTGAIAIVETNDEFNIWSPLALIRANKKKLLPRFVFYSMCADYFKTSVELSWSQGTQPNIGMGVIENLHVPLAPVEEQRNIINFLDHETAKIDTLIEKQQQLIKLLKEKRQAVISHAVTKGLNPNVPMRDSGVEWLGVVPAHWECCSLKHRARVVDCKHITAEFFDEGIPLASISEVKEWFINLQTAKLTSEKYYFDLIGGGRKPQPGDIIYSRNATVGEAALVAEDTPTFAMGQDVCLIRLDEDVLPEYVLHVLKSKVVIQQLDLAMVGSTFKRINVDDIRNFSLALPPYEEQVEIVDQLKRVLWKHDALVTKAQSAIELMQERRTALISAAVTGKIEVRDWQAPSQTTNQKIAA